MEEKKNIFVWVLPLLGIILLALVMLKRAPETFEDDGTFDLDVDEEPPNLLYQEVKGIGFELDKLYALALDAKDKIYVTGDSKLLILNPDGSEQSAIKLTTPGRCLVVAGNGNIYIGYRQYIEVFNSTGKKLASWDKIDDESVITSLALSGDFLFVADAGTRTISKFDLKGKLLGQIGVENKKEGIPKLIIPSPYFDLATAKDGSIWAVNPGRHKLENFTVDGKLKGMWGKYSPEMEGFCGCCNPTHIALMQDGSFVTSEKGYIRVKTYDPKGVFSGLVAGESQFRKKGQKDLIWL